LHGRLLNRLTAAKAKVVVFDIIFDEAGVDVAADQEFAAALRASGKVVRTELDAIAGRFPAAVSRELFDAVNDRL